MDRVDEGSAQVGDTADNMVVAVLGAGLASRFGGGKLDQPCGGRPLGAWAVQTAIRTGHPVMAVVGPGESAFLSGFAPHAVTRIVNPVPEAGMGHSVALAAQAAAARGAHYLLVLLADMPLVRPATLARLAETAARHSLAATAYPDGRRGVPACFAQAHFAALGGLAGDAGARVLLQTCPPEALLAVDPAELVDVDRPEDLGQVAQMIGDAHKAGTA